MKAAMKPNKGIDRARMDGVFDYLRRMLREQRGIFEAFAPRPGLPAPLPPAGLPAIVPAPPGRRPSIFRPLGPAALPAPPAPMFQPLVPFAPLPAPLPREEEQRALWERLFPRPMEAPPSAAEAFSMFAPAAPAPEIVWEALDWHRRFPDIAETTGGRIPRWMGLGWEVPNTWQLMGMLEGEWDLVGMFEHVLSNTEGPWWTSLVEASAHVGEPARIEIDRIAGWGDPYGDLATFFGIPEHVVAAYVGADPELATHFWQEVLDPLLDRLTKAMDALKPPRFQGWFEIDQADDGSFLLVYKQAAFRPALQAP
jgi:hypothetical protein